MQILSEPVTSQTFIFHCTEHTLSFSKGRTRNGLIHSWADIRLDVNTQILYLLFLLQFLHFKKIG